MAAGAAEGLDVARDQKRHVEAKDAVAQAATSAPASVGPYTDRTLLLELVRAMARDAARLDYSRERADKVK